MNLMNILITTLVLLSLISCTTSNSGWNIGMRNIRDYALILEKNMPVKLQGIGGAMPDGDFKELFASFQIQEEADIEKARVLISQAIENFLVNINKDSVLRPYLNHFPFTYKDVEVGLSFSSEEEGFVINNHIAYVSLISGNLVYRIYNEKTEMLETIAREPYLEALEKVKGKNEESLLSVADPS